MIEKHLQQTPLAPFHLELRAQTEGNGYNKGILISECPLHFQFTLRGDSSDKNFLSSIKKATGITPPNIPSSSSKKTDGTRILCISPNEWLIISPIEANNLLHDKIENALKGRYCAIVDVSHSRTILRITGEKARETLMKGCSVDLHPIAFKPGDIINTTLAKAQVILQKIGGKNNSETYDIFVFRSYTHYLWTWLTTSTREYSQDI